MAKAIAKTETKELDLSPEEKKRLFDPEVSGMDSDLEQPRMDFPRLIKILQSENQWKWFGKNEVSPSDYGKLFFNKGEEAGCHADLMDSIEGTILKVERGCIIFTDDKKREIVSKQPDMIPPSCRDVWISENSPYVYQNQSRVTVALHSAVETLEMLKARSDGDMGVEMPLAVILLKGSSYGQVFELWKQMTDLMKDDSYWSTVSSKDRKGILKSLFKLTVKTEKLINEDSLEYYSPIVNLSLNTAQEALSFEQLVINLDEFPFYGAKAVEIVETGGVVDPKYAKSRKVLEGMEQKEDPEEITPEEVEKKTIQ